MFSDPQQGHEYSRFFGIYVEIFEMWTSRQQNEVLNIVQAKKYPEVPTFWRLFCRPKMAEISNLLSHFNAMCHNICVKPAEGYNLLGAFYSALIFMSKQSLCIFKEVILKRNLSVWKHYLKKGTTQHASRHSVNRPAQNLKKKHQKLYLFKRTDQYSGQEISLMIAWVSTG